MTEEEKKKEIKVEIPRKRFRNPLYGSKLRNKPCICGSGKKMKKCHGMDYAISEYDYEMVKKMYNKKAQELQQMLSNIEPITE